MKKKHTHTHISPSVSLCIVPPGQEGHRWIRKTLNILFRPQIKPSLHKRSPAQTGSKIRMLMSPCLSQGGQNRQVGPLPPSKLSGVPEDAPHSEKVLILHTTFSLRRRKAGREKSSRPSFPLRLHSYRNRSEKNEIHTVTQPEEIPPIFQNSYISGSV